MPPEKMLIGGVSEKVGSSTAADKQQLSRIDPLRVAGLVAVPFGFALTCFLAVTAAGWLPTGETLIRYAAAAAAVLIASATLLSAALLSELDHIKRDLRTAEREARTQRRQLTHLGRVAVLGQLSGAFAHELNQPLTSILGNAEAALRLLGATACSTELQEILHDIIEEDLRAAQVIQRLRALFDKAESMREPVNLNTTVQEVLGLCRSELIARNVRAHADLDTAIPAVMADRVQMQQVILNLLMNACDAMAERPVAERTVCLTTRVTPEPPFVTLSVADSGPGIAATDLERVFQPFFSSKSNGMGLGLAICRSVAESHCGKLWAENAGGAVFHLELPAGGALS